MNKPKWVVDFYNEWGFYPIAGGGGGGDEAPGIPGLTSPEGTISGSSILSNLQNIINQYQTAQLGAPAEWGQQGDILQSLLGYTPQLSYLTEPSEYGKVSSELEKLLGYTPEQFAFPMEDIQKALAEQQALQYEQFQKQINPVMAAQGQLDSSYYANQLGDYLKGQQAQTYGTTADLLTQQALNNLQLQQWLPQFKTGVLSGLQNVGGARSGVEQYNVGLKNALQEWLPNWQAGIAGQIGNLGTQKLGLGQYNLELPLSTYVPQMENLYGIGQGESNRQYSAAMDAYNAAMNEYNQKQAQRGGMFGALGTLGGAAIGSFIPGVGPFGGAQLGSMFSPLWGGSGGGGSFSMPQSWSPDNWKGWGWGGGGGWSPSTIRGGVGGSTGYSPQFGNTWSPY